MNRLPWTEEEVYFALGIHQTNSEQELRQQLRPFIKTKKKNTKKYKLRLLNQKRQTFNGNVKNL